MFAPILDKCSVTLLIGLLLKELSPTNFASILFDEIKIQLTDIIVKANRDVITATDSVNAKFHMENDFPISLTYNSITDDEENWKNPISQSTEVKKCKPF